ncbi:MAG TPA: flagellar biosynthetic protein FliR [Dissulfurispiraceae bacterium]|nr:flagellar biosynthetic protein FliR [Dissulfurispiraceae bacterium]
MELIDLVNIYAGKFVPVFIRVAVILFFIPFVGSRTTPIFLRTGISLALTLLLLPVVEVKTADPLKAVFEAFFIGAAIGLMARIILGAVETAAQWVGLEMGLSVAAVFNPQFGEVLSPLSLFYNILAMALFFILDIHHLFIEGIVRSFDMTTVHYTGIFNAVLKLNEMLFPLALKIAAPVILVQVLANLMIGFFSRAIPQANIFFISFPILITAGLVFIILSMPLVTMVISRSFINVRDAIQVFTR